MSRAKIWVTILAFAVAANLSGAYGRGGGGGFGGRGMTGTGPSAMRMLGHDRNDVMTRNRDGVGRPAASRSRAGLDRDEHGALILRGKILVVMPGDADLATVAKLNFAVAARDEMPALGLVSATLTVPGGMAASEALALLRRAVPDARFDYIHVYDPSGADTAAAGWTAAGAPGTAEQVGMIDGGVLGAHASLRRAAIIAANFAGSTASPPTVHGTAIASLLVGQDGSFAGHLPGARLFAADVYGGNADGGNAVAIARALDWMAAQRIAVVNISLAGPDNALLAVAVRRFLARGHVLVAAAGNEGPAGRPRFPAAYAGVVAVTAVNADRRLLIDASPTVSGFAALGDEVRAARLPYGYARYSGTSFAVPAVTAAFARLLPRPDAGAANSALAALTRRSPRLAGAGEGWIYLIDYSSPP